MELIVGLEALNDFLERSNQGNKFYKMGSCTLKAKTDKLKLKTDDFRHQQFSLVEKDIYKHELMNKLLLFYKLFSNTCQLSVNAQY